MAYRDFYKILGIGKDASEKDIKKAYRKLASTYHPDKTKGDQGKEDRFKEISEAYRVLGNAEKRKQYDTLGEDWELFQQSGHTYGDFVEKRGQFRGQQRNRYEGAAGSREQGRDFSDIFESFFGREQGNRSRAYAYPGADVSGEVHLSLEEAFQGVTRILDVEGNKIKLKIKPGAYDGLQLKARGKGQKGGMGKAGDLYIAIRVDAHPLYKRVGADLYMRAELPLFDALLGGKIEINTLSGKVQIPVKEGTPNGKTVRLRGKGMPVYGKEGRFGDLIVSLEVKLPGKLSEEQKATIEKWRAGKL